MYSGSAPTPPSVWILSPYITWLQVGFPPLSHQRFCWSSRSLWESVIADLPLGSLGLNGISARQLQYLVLAGSVKSRRDAGG